MVKPARNMSSSSLNFGKIADFIQVYRPQTSSKKMRIPPSITKDVRGDVSFNSIIRNRFNNKEWRVNLRKDGDYFAFEKGWQTFVKDNTLEDGDFLTFSYNGSSEFEVTVYGEDQRLKEFPVIPDSDQPLPCKSEEVMCEENEDDLTRSSQLDKPFFEIVLKKSQIEGEFTTIPVEFVKKYLREETPIVSLKCANKLWAVKIIKRKASLGFSGGWRNFVRNNSLKEGYFCRFELISTRTFDVIVNGNFISSRITAKKSEHYPNFQIELAESYVARGFVHIPTDFGQKYLDKPIERVMLKYSSEELWPVKFKSACGKRPSFGSGLSAFFKKNNLQVKDVCLFELIDKENYVFKVSVCS